MKASDAAAYDFFGASLSLDADTLAVGAYGKGGSATFHRGGAYVFVRSNGRWDQQAVLAPLTPNDSDEFGESVAVSGNTLLVGAWQDNSASTGINGAHDTNALLSGAGYLFVRSGTVWTQRAYLKASTTRPDDYLGASAAITPKWMALGGEKLACVFTNP